MFTAALNHPKLVYEWFTAVLLRWNSDEGLVVYERWAISTSGIVEAKSRDGTVLLDFYYLMYFVAFVMVLVLMHRWRKSGWLKVRKHVPYDALLVAMLGVLIGAHSAYILIYNPEFYFGAPPIGPADNSEMLSRIFLNWSGMASHGAAAGILIGAFLWWLKSRAPVVHLGDVGVIAGAFGAICIRLANFVNGELYGRAASESLPWAMRFPVRNAAGNRLRMHNGKWYELVPQPDGVTERARELTEEPYRLGYELFAKTENGITIVSPDKVPTEMGNTWFQVVTTPRHPSQLYQLILEGVLLFIALLFVRRRAKRVGMVSAAFFIGYPLARFIGEFFRQPDVQFQEQGNAMGTVLLGLSMGQLLSVAMMAFGFGLLFYYRKHGQVIAEMEIWPPKKAEEEPAEKSEKEPTSPGQDPYESDDKLKVPFEPGMGGSTSAGSISGIQKVRKALEEKEREWEDEGDDSHNPEDENGRQDDSSTTGGGN
ncbi:MAG: prolipoprotein diacylglyceryl transferase [Nitrospira sp.]|nr:prolipoprotein diacylglyceryl transferase [Nitrospira sp.]